MKIKYFELHEWFRSDVVNKYGDTAWNFLDPRLLKTMNNIRRIKDAPILINHSGMEQRGFRDNKCEMVQGKSGIYVSPHCTGKGVDFNVEGESATETRLWLIEIVDALPYKIRLERKYGGHEITWVHLDLYTLGQEEKIKFFDV